LDHSKFLAELKEVMGFGATVISKEHSKDGFILLPMCPNAGFVFCVVASQRIFQALSSSDGSGRHSFCVAALKNSKQG
jgi:hypothetical protein